MGHGSPLAQRYPTAMHQQSGRMGTGGGHHSHGGWMVALGWPAAPLSNRTVRRLVFAGHLGLLGSDHRGSLALDRYGCPVVTPTGERSRSRWKAIPVAA